MLFHLIAVLPMVWLVVDTSLGRLTVNPLQDWTFRTGDWALRWLVVSLACTPINTIFGYKPALKARRLFGLYGFGYALVHFMIFIGVDYGFAFDLIWDDLATKRYILAGFAALLLLIPLAITSTNSWLKRLGKRWKTLHKLTYIAIPLTVIHYIWLVKSDVREPVIYAGVVLILLFLRIPTVRQKITQWRYHFKQMMLNVHSANSKTK
jgi:sulfoxide reductase heme-binding subunit YedZ